MTERKLRTGLFLLAGLLPVLLLAAAPSAVGAQDLLIRGGTVLTVTNGDLPDTDVLIRSGRIEAIGPGLSAPAGVRVIDARGLFVCPGFLDDHSHMGVDRGINEGSRSVTPEVSISDVIRHDDPSFFTALAGGITTIHTMHGSANSIGGECETIKIKWGRPWEELVITDAPRTLKFALGENVRQSRSDNPTRYPRSRSGVAEVMRESFSRARAYMETWDRYSEERTAYERTSRRQRPPLAPLPPKRDLQLEILAGVLKGEVIIRCHAYRADEMAMMVEVCNEFGIPGGVFEHALDGYKIAPELARNGWSVSVFADSWAYKIEAYDANPYKMKIFVDEGVRCSINSDSAERVRRLYQEAARACRFGGVPEDEALKMITINSAENLGISHRVGSLEVGKDGDVTIFTDHPIHTEARCEMTIIEGVVYFDRSQVDTLADWPSDGGDEGTR